MAPSTHTVERTVTIRAHAPAVCPHIADFHRWTAWSPWEDMDPDLTRAYSGAESGTGADEPKRVTIALQFLTPFKSSSETVFLIEPDGPGTTVTWRMTGPSTPMTKVMGLPGR